ncbi:hypothetical protein [Pedobacter gandavensis]|uniref:hypothetical protein n=1 Tax=Pedobacter gandavensis TaxID=2679963 RepID=UPI00292DC3EB|nr:hypothetical protein [Pedobacter gandavensis]
MIYISAQPDTIYFIWQLEIQLRNLNSLNLSNKNIHVLVSYHKDLGLRKEFKKFIEQNKTLASFHCYPDLREDVKYVSSLRPNILKQHFELYPELEKETLFYHDSDILFSRLPQIPNVEENEICYVSDTRNYLDLNYITKSASESLLHEMLKIVGISKEVLIKEDPNTGGAQYILKGITADFWKKIEADSEALFILMTEYNTRRWEEEYPVKKELRSKSNGIQAWCADMWAMLWNLWYFDKKVEIHTELDFSWPYSPIEHWEEKAIQHYSGAIKDKNMFFRKSEYTNYAPWYDPALSNIPPTNCSYEIVRLIKKRKKEMDNERLNFKESVIVIEAENACARTLEIYDIIKLYITKTLNIEIFLFTWADFKDHQRDDILTKQMLAQMLSQQAGGKMLWLPLHHLVDVNSLTELLRSQQPHHSHIHRINFQQTYKVDSLFLEAFSKTLDEDLFHQNLGKFNIEHPNPDKFVILIDSDKISHNDDHLSIIEFLTKKPNRKTQKIQELSIGLPAFNLAFKFN